MAILLAGFLTCACAGARPPGSDGLRMPTPPHPGFSEASATSGLPWAAGEAWFVLVDVSCRTVSIYRHGEWWRTYEGVSFGRIPGDKIQEGDRRTPRGLYSMVGRRRHPRWSHFILLDYPNATDLAAHGRSRARGEANAGPGAEIGIHGTDVPVLNRDGVDWTYGCVSLLNEDVAELYATVPEGTLVLIED